MTQFKEIRQHSPGPPDYYCLAASGMKDTFFILQGVEAKILKELLGNNPPPRP